VPRRDLLGRGPRAPFFYAATAADAADAGFDDAFIYDELKIAPAGPAHSR